MDGLFTRHFCLDHTSIQKNLLFGWTQCNNSQFSGHSIPLDTRHLIKRRAATNPPGFFITDIPRFPEPAPPREDTDPATAERLGLDRRQMRDTIAYSDGKGYMDLISLSSRRRGRHIAQMPPVRAGGCRLSGLADGITHHISFRHISIKSSFIHKYIEHNSSYLGTVLLFTEYIHNCIRNLDSYYSRLCLSADFSLKRSI